MLELKDKDNVLLDVSGLTFTTAVHKLWALYADHESVITILRSININDEIAVHQQCLDQAVDRIEDGFAAITSMPIKEALGRTTAHSLGGAVQEGASCRLRATSGGAAVEQFKKDFNDWLMLETDGRKKGFTLLWAERPVIMGECREDLHWGSQCAYYTIWWRCAVVTSESRDEEIRLMTTQRRKTGRG